MTKQKLTWKNFDFYMTLCPKHESLCVTKRWVVWPFLRRYTAYCGTKGCSLSADAFTIKRLMAKWESATSEMLRPKA